MPYDVDSPAVHDDHEEISERDEACAWFSSYRDAAREVLLDNRRSAQVAFDDDLGPFGAIGLIGNVKEWVDDLAVDDDKLKALVCGGTAHLGSASFEVGYYATLFPENTNPDVGFRVARSLAPGESAAFDARESELRGLV